MQSSSSAYTFRAPTWDDVASVAAIQHAVGTADFGSSNFTEDVVRAAWKPERIDLGADAWLAIDPNGTPVAYAEAPQTEEHVWALLWVLPEHRGNGLEAELLERAEARTIAHGRSTTITGRASDLNLPSMQAHDQRGYNNYLSFQIMQVDLIEPPPAPGWPEGIAVRPFLQEQDEQATYLADEESAEDKGYHDPLTFDAWATRMGLNKPDFDPTLWYLAFHGHDLAGVALNYYDVKSNAGWIDHLGVRRPWRKQGLGKALLLHSFREFYSRNIHTIKLSVDSASLTNAPRLYEDVGMQVIQKYHIYRKYLPSSQPQKTEPN